MRRRSTHSKSQNMQRTQYGFQSLQPIKNIRQAKINFIKHAKLGDETAKEKYCHQLTEKLKGVKETMNCGRKLLTKF